MDFLLNELSLQGQFDSTDSFLKSLPCTVKCIELIHQNANMPIYKTEDFYKCSITQDMKLCDLKNYQISDELLQFKIKLDNEIYEEPVWDTDPYHDIEQKFFWDGEDVSATSLAEAVARKGALLSFFLDEFRDCVLNICKNEEKHDIVSVHSPQYLTEQYGKLLNVDRKTWLLLRYEGSRIDCSLLEDKYGADILEKNEFKELVSTLDKFVRRESWEAIAIDDGLEYKKYSPENEEKNWFSGGKYKGKTIMKFRYSKVMRCFGYRKGDRFRILRIERDHKISYNG